MFNLSLKTLAHDRTVVMGRSDEGRRKAARVGMNLVPQNNPLLPYWDDHANITLLRWGRSFSFSSPPLRGKTTLVIGLP